MPIPMAMATIPPSASGVSKTRGKPNRSCNPWVARNTPPKYPTSSPNTQTLGSRSSMTSSPERIAWIMFIVDMAEPYELLVYGRHNGNCQWILTCRPLGFFEQQNRWLFLLLIGNVAAKFGSLSLQMRRQRLVYIIEDDICRVAKSCPSGANSFGVLECNGYF